MRSESTPSPYPTLPSVPHGMSCCTGWSPGDIGDTLPFNFPDTGIWWLPDGEKIAVREAE